MVCPRIVDERMDGSMFVDDGLDCAIDALVGRDVELYPPDGRRQRLERLEATRRRDYLPLARLGKVDGQGPSNAAAAARDEAHGPRVLGDRTDGHGGRAKCGVMEVVGRRVDETSSELNVSLGGEMNGRRVRQRWSRDQRMMVCGKEDRSIPSDDIERL